MRNQSYVIKTSRKAVVLTEKMKRIQDSIRQLEEICEKAQTCKEAHIFWATHPALHVAQSRICFSFIGFIGSRNESSLIGH